MNMHTAQLLEKHFDTAFAAPDGIKKLRELILTLAMQGRLVPQDPSDQPTSELLREIDVEKQRLIKKGAIKKTKSLPSIKEEEKPYSLPQGWDWARLQSFSDYNGRPNIDPSEIAEDTWLLDLEDIEKETSRLICRARYSQRESKSTKSTFKEGDVLYGKLRPYLDKVLVADSAGVCTTEIVPIVPSKAVIPEFLRWLLKRPDFLSHVNTLMYGVKMPRLGTEDAIHSVHPIPPVNEQYRIVAKINELMVRCDGLEKLRTAQQGGRVKVHAAAIKQLLNIAEPDQYQRAQAFLAEHFGELYTVKENVTELRKAVLQLAVMGKLVPQNPNDQPASGLLKDIEADKQRLISEGQIKIPKPLPPVTKEEKPYALPQGWEWVRLGELAEFINGDRGKNYPNREEYVSEGIPWINTGHIDPDGSLTCRDMNFITKHKFDSLNGGKIRLGDLVYCLRGATFGKTAIVDPYGEGAIASSLMIIRPYVRVFNRYMYHYLVGPVGRGQIFRFDNGSAQPNLSSNSVRYYVYPLPPLSEQKRIVARIDALKNLCDSLDQKIEEATRKRTNLLSALMSAQSKGGAVDDAQRSSRSTAQFIDLATYRASIGCYAFNKLANAQYFGRTAAAKVMYLAQAHIGLDLDLKPERKAAGPLDKWIYDFERQGQGESWFEVNERTLTNGRKKTEYRCLSGLSEPAAKAEALMLPGQKAEFDRLIYVLADKKTEEVEILATLFAVWNDFLIDGVRPTDAQIISDVRENWHESKARFTAAELGRWLDWLRRENITPRGLPPRTVQQSRLGFD
ncbi:TPA: restriction endonuclease subunit S [Stenotrophomonas maltophilia]|nr:restriction endonuclease subunit S [Stenotrophomonas maltophilia]